MISQLIIQTAICLIFKNRYMICYHCSLKELEKNPSAIPPSSEWIIRPKLKFVKFSPTWRCVSLWRPTISSGWKPKLHIHFQTDVQGWAEVSSLWVTCGSSGVNYGGDWHLHPIKGDCFSKWFFIICLTSGIVSRVGVISVSLQSQMTVTDPFIGKQLLPFVFAWQSGSPAINLLGSLLMAPSML